MDGKAVTVFPLHVQLKGVIAPKQHFIVALTTDMFDWGGKYQGRDVEAGFNLGWDNARPTLVSHGGMLILFKRDGNRALDVDYVGWGANTRMGAQYMDMGTLALVQKSVLKTDYWAEGQAYARDVPAVAQNAYTASSFAGALLSLQRCDYGEATERRKGGNGASGHDETSERFEFAFGKLKEPSPGARAPTLSTPSGDLDMLPGCYGPE